MATKEEILQYIRILAKQKVVTREELIEAFDSASGVKTEITFPKKFGITEILYYTGGAVIFLGIVVLLWRNWSTLGEATKILATFGSGIAAYFAGVFLGRNKSTEIIGSAFFLISALATPIGLWVIFDSAGLDAESFGSQSLISGIMLGTYLLSLLVFQKKVLRVIFILFSILFGTWLFFSVTSWMVEDLSPFPAWKYYLYRALVVGMAYLLIGHAFAKGEFASLSGLLYNFGALGFLGAALGLGGWEPSQNVFWEVIYPGLVFGALFLSVYLRSKAILVWGAVFLIAYILKITAEYFATGLGWPLALVIAGLAMIGVGYLAFSIKNRYLSV
jgi:hypothetical protein